MRASAARAVMETLRENPARKLVRVLADPVSFRFWDPGSLFLTGVLWGTPLAPGASPWWRTGSPPAESGWRRPKPSSHADSPRLPPPRLSECCQQERPTGKGRRGHNRARRWPAAPTLTCTARFHLQSLSFICSFLVLPCDITKIGTWASLW